CQHYDNSPFTF
nr:immunoglobulin light chain junction region [Macaca mulatta]